MDTKGRPLARSALHLNLASMIGDDLIAYGQPQSSAFLLGGKERVEDFPQMVFGDSVSGVGDPQDQLLSESPPLPLHSVQTVSTPPVSMA